MSDGPLPVFHITHWKAGSQWVRGVLQRLVGPRLVELQPRMAEVLQAPIRPEGVYSPVYLARDRFEGAVQAPHRRFIVIRDLRDTLVSWYFSLAVSHPVEGNDIVTDFRASLAQMEKQQGLQWLIANRLLSMARIQWTWLKQPGELVLRYEDMIADEQEAFRRICRHCGIDVPDEARREAVALESFEARSGRRPGQEDVTQHHRKGVAGDWRNHFSQATKAAFKERFGQLLLLTGYEKTIDW